jgi:hypothetical protein
MGPKAMPVTGRRSLDNRDAKSPADRPPESNRFSIAAPGGRARLNRWSVSKQQEAAEREPQSFTRIDCV